MEKKKWLTVVVIILVWAVGLACAIFYVNNKYSYKVPLNHFMDALNNKDISEIPKAYHEYCSELIEQHMSEETFDMYTDDMSRIFGSDYKFSYEIISISSMSQEDVEMYEEEAKRLFSNWPYLSNGGTLKFDDIYTITTEITVKGEYHGEKEDVDFTVVKIDSKCYFLHTSNMMLEFFI